MEGQGVPTPQKFSRIFARDLSERAGRKVDVLDYSHSGATLSRYHGSRAPLQLGSCTEGFRAPQEVPVITPPVLDCQIPAAATENKRIDIAVINGCINDVGPFPPADRGDYRASTNLISGTQSPKDAIEDLCSAHMVSAIKSAHNLSGNPKVVLAGAHFPVSDQTLPKPLRDALKTMIGRQLTGGEVLKVIDRYTNFVKEYEAMARRAIVIAGGQEWATYADSGLGPENSLFAPKSLVWSTGTDDPLFNQRSRACDKYAPNNPGCRLASIAHPSTAGQRVIAHSLIETKAIRNWFLR